MGVLDPNDIESFINRHIDEICAYYGVHTQLVFTSRSKDERRMNAIMTIVYFLKKHTILSHREIANIVKKDVSLSAPRGNSFQLVCKFDLGGVIIMWGSPFNVV